MRDLVEYPKSFMKKILPFLSSAILNPTALVLTLISILAISIMPFASEYQSLLAITAILSLFYAVGCLSYEKRDDMPKVRFPEEWEKLFSYIQLFIFLSLALFLQLTLSSKFISMSIIISFFPLVSFAIFVKVWVYKKYKKEVISEVRNQQRRFIHRMFIILSISTFSFAIGVYQSSFQIMLTVIAAVVLLILSSFTKMLFEENIFYPDLNPAVKKWNTAGRVPTATIALLLIFGVKLPLELVYGGLSIPVIVACLYLLNRLYITKNMRTTVQDEKGNYYSFHKYGNMIKDFNLAKTYNKKTVLLCRNINKEIRENLKFIERENITSITFHENGLETVEKEEIEQEIEEIRNLAARSNVVNQNKLENLCSELEDVAEKAIDKIQEVKVYS